MKRKNLTPEQERGEFIIGSDIAQDRYRYDKELLVDDLYFDGGFEKSDYELMIPLGDEFPNALKIVSQSLSRILANYDMVSFLLDLEGNGQYYKLITD